MSVFAVFGMSKSRAVLLARESEPTIVNENGGWRNALAQYRAAEKAIFDWINTPPAAS